MAASTGIAAVSASARAWLTGTGATGACATPARPSASTNAAAIQSRLTRVRRMDMPGLSDARAGCHRPAAETAAVDRLEVQRLGRVGQAEPHAGIEFPVGTDVVVDREDQLRRS